MPLRASAPLHGPLRTALGASTSTNWSGYAAYEATFTSAQGNWVQPRADCQSVRRHRYTLAAFWTGLDGYENNTVEQTGTEADCEGPTPVYYAWWELYPKAPTVIEEPVQPGDEMHARVTQDELVLEDLTAEWTFKQSFPARSLAFASAEWIAEAPARGALTDFGSVHFSGVSASSDALSEGAIESEAWRDYSITLERSPRHPTALATMGALEEEASAFTIQENAAAAAPPREPAVRRDTGAGTGTGTGPGGGVTSCRRPPRSCAWTPARVATARTADPWVPPPARSAAQR
ncbi:MAG: G1 family endopeptidase [Solirubrobacterales bacterium]|nr:G1 family endopeptidase [Solirubrobacterales bacterium]